MLKKIICCVCILCAFKAYAKDHYIINVYFSNVSDFYAYPQYLQEDVVKTVLENLRPWIRGNTSDNRYSIVLTELSIAPADNLGVKTVAADLAYDQLSSNLLSVLTLRPTGPNCPDELSKFGTLKYINSKLPSSEFFDNTYLLSINTDFNSSDNIDQARYGPSLQILNNLKDSAQVLFSSTLIRDNVVNPIYYRATNPADSMYKQYSLEVYLQEDSLAFSDEFISDAAIKSPVYTNNLLYDRLTQPGDKLALFPATGNDSVCKLSLPVNIQNAALLPFYGFFKPGSGNVNSFNIPINWCLAGSSSNSQCGLAAPVDNSPIEGSLTTGFPIYTLLQKYLVIEQGYNNDSLYRGSFMITGNLINGVYDHLSFTTTVNFTISIVRPLVFKKAGHKDIILNNKTLLESANDLLDGQPSTQKQVFAALTKEKNKTKLIVIIILVAAIVAIILYYYRKTERVKQMFGMKSVV